jgi:hypothetical protein
VKAFGTVVRNAGLQIAALGAAITAPLAAATYAAARSGEALYDMSKRTGIAVERLATLSYAAAQTSTDMEALEKGVRQMQKTISGVDDATQGTVKGLEHIGIATEAIRKLAPEKQFDLVAQKLNAIRNPTDRATAAMKVFGRAGTALIPMIESMRVLEGQAKRFGFVKSAEEVRRAKEFSMTLRVAEFAAKDLGEAVGAAVMPVLKETTERMTNIVLRIRDWVKRNPELIASVFRIAVGVGIAGTAIAALGTAFIGLGSVVGIAATVIGAIGSVMAALLSPIGLVVTAVVGLGGYFLYTSGVGKQAVDQLVRAFHVLQADVQGVFGAIVTAFRGGDLIAAARVGMALLQLEWTRGVVALKEVFGGLIPYVKWGFDNIKTIATAGWLAVQAAASEMADRVIAYGQQIWDAFMAGIDAVVARFKWLGTTAATILGKISSTAQAAAMAMAIMTFSNLPAAPAVPKLPTLPPVTSSQRTQDLRAAATAAADALAKSFAAMPHTNMSAANAKEIADAQQALAEAIRQANATPGIQGVGVGPDPTRMADAMEQAMKFSSAGTFNPFGAGQLAGPMNQLVLSAREQTRILRSLDRKAGAGRPVFT